MGVMDALGGIGESVGSFMGEKAGAGYRKLSDKEYEEALQALMELQGPDYQDLGPSAMAGARADPRTVAAQMKALEQLGQIADSRGLTSADEARFLESQDRVAEQERGQRGALMQNFAARGQGGGQAELASLLSNQQGAANRLNRAGTQMAGDASERALHAMSQSGQLGSQIRGQDFGEQAQKAQAQDAIARFNAQQRQARWSDNLRLEQMKSGARFGKADRWNEKADRIGRQLSGVGRASGSVLGATGDVAGMAAGSPAGMAAVGGYFGGNRQPGAAPRRPSMQEDDNWYDGR